MESSTTPPNTNTTLLSQEANLFELKPDTAALHIHTTNPPASWKNYLFNPDYYVELDQCAQGRTRVLQSPARDLPASYRYFYLKDEATEAVWNLSCQPLSTALENFEAIHNTSHSSYSGQYAQIESKLVGFVPVSGSREFWTVQLTNTSKQTRKLSLSSNRAPQRMARFTVMPVCSNPMPTARRARARLP
ncbi:MAG TPA: hypothetical protein DEA90_13495 [Opitutae bacterium]|nr:hypothetical protein [Puniceicoccaceae bacterium]HBR95170.1 hypothetical protein [Opitutae bacterium]|tara:strand:+ start:6642 stop:7211 length:570 start_codon:yes stop_codon:yes gene_type:complete